MLRNISKIVFAFSLLFLALTILLIPFQLMGVTDQGYWINSLYNFIHSGEFVTSFNDRHNFSEHSLLLLISPLALIRNPILFSYVLYYLTYLSWFLTFYLLYFGKFNYQNFLKSFILFFCSTTVIFHYALNFNGWNSIYISPPILMAAYFFAFIKNDYHKSILIYLPLLLLKIQFWIILPFFLLAIYYQSRDKKFIFYVSTSIIIFLLYLFGRQFLFAHSTTGNLLNLSYSHILNGNIKVFFEIFFNSFMVKIALISAFFIQFIFLFDLKNISKNDFLTYALLIFPIFSYCILSDRTVMSYWTHEHYVLPVLPVIFLILKKYGAFSRKRITLFILVNIVLITGIYSLKEPWQFKYYQDQNQLVKKIQPLLVLNHNDHILSDDRTGLYLANYQANFLKFITDKTRPPKYIIINTRYIFYTNNIKRAKSINTISSFEYVQEYEKNLDGYGILYLNYPFVVYENNLKSEIKINSKVIDDWDVKFNQLNKFL
ncbi:hypothetical protein [Candidatus Pseudothioglobus sp. Uisw_050_01]|uniref:hypothetical protein n=1 Tax=Candidatus Pseudothioglobus sp. Uisw_050_01 TaxID=3230997 RepID=UPI003A84478E